MIHQTECHVSQIEQVKRVLANHQNRLSVLCIDFRRALAEPESVAAEVRAFLGGMLDADAAIEAIDPSLRRQGARGSNQTKGEAA